MKSSKKVWFDTSARAIEIEKTQIPNGSSTKIHVDPSEKGAAKGAIIGGAAGAPFGPFGIVVGTIVGTIIGGILGRKD